MVGGAAIAAGTAKLAPRYRRDLAAAHQSLDAVDRVSVPTRFGDLEYAETGAGEPLLLSHGIFHGCDGGLAAVRDIVVGRRVIVPSRFGYLGSALPADATVADQAEAFVALLDHLELTGVDVMAVSAGTSAAVQLGLTHPDRVRNLILSSGSFPGSTTAEAPPGWATVFYSDPAMWTLKLLARPMFARLMGVPEGFPRDADQAAQMQRLLDSIFPVDPRAQGATFDAFTGNPAINSLPLEDLSVPTLLIHAQDDPLADFAAAREASRRIPGARLVVLESGGHLQLGQNESVRSAIEAFLTTPDPMARQ